MPLPIKLALRAPPFSKTTPLDSRFVEWLDAAKPLMSIRPSVAYTRTMRSGLSHFSRFFQNGNR